MNAFEALGFAIVVLSTGLSIAAFFILAGFGAVVAWRCFCRGLDAIQQDTRFGTFTDQLIRESQHNNHLGARE